MNPDAPVSFGYKMVWLAVRTVDAGRLAAALGLTGAQPCNWKTGVERAYDGDHVFITPPVDGWTLALGFPLSGEEAEITARLDALSRQFGEAQYFGTHRVSEYHAWARSVAGQLVRHYAYVGDQGETLQNFGEMTPAEPVNLIDTAGPESDTAEYPDEETVMRVAGAWSIDPTALGERTDAPPTLGLLAQ